MRIVITGMAGFIGRRLGHLMQSQGFDVVGCDSRPETASDESAARCRVIDVLNYSALLEFLKTTQPDVIVHLAARTDLAEKHDFTRYQANIDGVRNLCEAVREIRSVERVLYTSTQLVCKPGYAPRNDQDYNPHTPYGESKVRTEQIVRELDGGGVTWCLIRPTTVWGPGMSAHYQRMLSLIDRGRFFHCGTREYFKSYGYIGNVAYQYLRLATADAERIKRRVFYVADYEPLSLKRYIDSLARALGRSRVPTLPLWCAKALSRVGDTLNLAGLTSFPFNSHRLANITAEYVFDLSATRDLCGDLPYTFQQGIEETAAWYAENCRPGQKPSRQRSGVHTIC